MKTIAKPIIGVSLLTGIMPIFYWLWQQSPLLTLCMASGLAGALIAIVYFDTRSIFEKFFENSGRRFDIIDRRFDIIDLRVGTMNTRSDNTDAKSEKRFLALEQKIERGFDELKEKTDKIDRRLIVVETKIDMFTGNPPYPLKIS